MSQARCETCQQRIVPEAAGLQCGCARLPWDAVLAFWRAYKAIPDGWPVLDTLDVMALALEDGHGAGDRSLHP